MSTKPAAAQASEVGLLRGIDQYRTSSGKISITACGVALVDAVGCDSIYKRADSFIALNYRTAVLRDDDKHPDAALEKAFVAGGGKLITWRAGRALEDEMFLSLSTDGVCKLLARAAALHGEELIDSHIKSESNGRLALDDFRTDLTPDKRSVLGKASRSKKNAWFKSVTWMEGVARDIVAPELDVCDAGFKKIIEDAFAWINDAGR